MSDGGANEITRLLRAWGAGNGQALEKLMPAVYDELHKVARQRMAAERSDHTLQPTALVNEVYLKLARFQELSWSDRAHFFAVCARLMRRILIDWARSRRVLKRGGEAVHVPLDQALGVPSGLAASWVALDDALEALRELDPRKCQVVELRFFAGFSVEETAKILNVSAETVKRDWKLAKVWILRELSVDGHA